MIPFPCLHPQWVPMTQVVANDYNPNRFAPQRLRLLQRSIQEHGLTQPIVVVFDPEHDQYVIVDGFHRYLVLRNHFQCSHIPVVLLEAALSERMASTVRHNRAKGMYEVARVRLMVQRLKGMGYSNTWIATRLGLQPDAVLAMLQAGIAESHEHETYSRSWVWDQGKVYRQQTVIAAALERLVWVFDTFEHVVVPVSGGKDSQFLFELAYCMAQERGRTIHAFFLDQEAEYQASIDVIRDIMARPGVVPHWYQVPIRMTNAASSSEDFLYAWEPGATWMREKDPLAIHELDGDYPQRFYPFLAWFERQWGPGTCSLLALRAQESLNRFRATTRHPALPGKPWTARGAGHVVKAYAIYDTLFDDIWKYFFDHGIRYNRIYDYLYSTDERDHIARYRVSFLCHEKSYRSLTTLQAFEPETYERLLRRVPGIRTAARYAHEQMGYRAQQLPPSFRSWREYRDHLLETLPTAHTEVFKQRFAAQPDTARVHQQQVAQLLINDWEDNTKLSPRQSNWREKWNDLL